MYCTHAYLCSPLSPIVHLWWPNSMRNKCIKQVKPEQESVLFFNYQCILKDNTYITLSSFLNTFFFFFFFFKTQLLKQMKKGRGETSCFPGLKICKLCVWLIRDGFEVLPAAFLSVVQPKSSRPYKYRTHITMCRLAIINYGNNTTKAHPKSITRVSSTCLNKSASTIKIEIIFYA